MLHGYTRKPLFVTLYIHTHTTKTSVGTCTSPYQTRELAEAEAMRRRREAEARAVRLSAEEAARLAALSVAEVETERLLKEAEEEAERHRLYLISLLAKETKPDTPEKPMTPQPLMQFGDAFKREKAL
jgi:hypothetical protein